jgi:hypothetical protein
VRGARQVIGTIWVVGSIAAAFYARHKQIPAAIAIPVAVAFLVELSMYATMGRRLFTRPWHLSVSALVPYLLYSIPTGVVAARSVLILAAVVAVLCWWLPSIRRFDFLFLAYVACVYLVGLRETYTSPWPGLRVDALGQLMWFRMAISSWLEHRGGEAAGFGFVPSREHWLTGIRYFLYLAPVVFAINWWIGLARPRLAPDFWWTAPATFFAILWVVALAEELFFRGVLLRRLEARLGAQAALVASSLAFGSVHLWFSKAFPNWKFALLATVAGLFYGRAFLATGSIRSAMVTHALTVTAWRTLFH